MRFRLAPFALICALSIVGMTLAHAQPKLQPRGGGEDKSKGGGQQTQTTGGLIEKITPDGTIALLKAAGYTDLETYADNQGNKHVKGKINGNAVAIVHYCEKGECQFISFVLPLGKQSNVDINWVNSWNYDKLFGKLSLDKEGNIFFQMECYLFGGVSPAHVTSAGKLFGELIKILYEYKPG